jgi:hypothetical protein
MKALKLAATLISTLVLAVIGTTPVAATEHGTLVSGFEMYATSSQGRFSGTATGTGSNGVSGAWSIVVDHSLLDPCFRMKTGDPCATVNGGSFTLAETSPARELITGQFESPGEVTLPQVNEIRLLNRGDNCSDQLFKIMDGLKNVGTGSPYSGHGSFVGYLWHHQRSFFGRCVTYAATVQGTVLLNY